MKVPLEFYETLRNRVSISDIARQKVSLVRKAANYVGLCPFHKEKTPSFTVNDSKKFYYCFGCTASGDVIKFNAQINGLSYQESAMVLANDHGVEIPKLTPEQKKLYEESDEISNVLELANKFFQSHLSPEISTYLRRRGINDKTIRTFNIGFAPGGKKLQSFFDKQSIPLMTLEKAGLVRRREDGRIYELFYDRIMFPIRNVYNKIVGFGGRVLSDGMPKYLNSPETILFQKHEILYAENIAISAAYKKNYSILVEGYLDVITLHQAGFIEAVASLGTSVSENHLQKLWKAGDEIILCFDADLAGMKANVRLIHLALPLIDSGKKLSFIRLPQGHDPDEIIRKKNTDFFAHLLDTRISLSEMIWLIEYEGKTFKTPEAKAALEKNLQDYCVEIKDKVLKGNYLRFFKDQMWEHLNRRQNKIVHKTSPSLFLNDYSEIEILEHAFCAILVKLPEMLKSDKIRDFIMTFNFHDNKLGDFRDWYFEEIIDNDICDLQEIRAIVERTGFFDTFLLLSQPDHQFLDIFFDKNDNHPDIFWEWLRKKYHLALLKNECATAISSGCDDAFNKAALYKKEMLQLSKELQVLNKSFINN